jgi:hypothetical protein
MGEMGEEKLKSSKAIIPILNIQWHFHDIKVLPA